MYGFKYGYLNLRQLRIFLRVKTNLLYLIYNLEMK